MWVPGVPCLQDIAKINEQRSTIKGGCVKIYVDNLSEKVTEDDLRKIFEPYGEVESIEVYEHQFGDRSRSFAYLDMPSDEDAIKAMEALYGTSIKGYQVKINQARTGPKDRRASDRGGGRRVTDPPAI
jgi:RNA recognition motif-containing protein